MVLHSFLASGDDRVALLLDAMQFEAAHLDGLWRSVVVGDAGSVEQFIAPSADVFHRLTVDFARFRGSYEARIYRDRVMPVRQGSVHDFFNLLAWKNFPGSKSAINRLHFENLIEESGGTRGPRRDFLTILDEAGVVVFVKPETDLAALIEELRELRRRGVASRTANPAGLVGNGDSIIQCLQAANADIAVIGHALTEALVCRPESVANTGAFAVIVPQRIERTPSGLLNLNHVDRILADYLSAKANELKPSLFPSLRLDVVFQFIQCRKFQPVSG